MIKYMYSLKNIKNLAAATRSAGKNLPTAIREPNTMARGQGGVIANKKRTPGTMTTSLSRIGKLPKRVQAGRSNDRLNEYQSQYKAKQEIKNFYGNISERDLINFVKKARKLGNNDQSVISLLERKLDVVVFRLGFSKSIPEARFLIKTGHILVNNKKIRYHHYLVENGSTIKSTSLVSFINKVLYLKLNQFKLPSHLYIPALLEATNSNITSLAQNPNNTTMVFPPKTEKNTFVLEGIFIKTPLESEVYLTVDFPINKFNYFINKY